MSVDMGFADVVSRIQDIQSMLGAVPAAVTTAPAASTGFASSLADATSTLATASSATAGTAAPATSTPSGADVVADARKYLGVPYVWGGTDPKKGLDCSALVQRVYSDLGITLPRVSYDQVRQGRAVASMADARPGDILGFGSPAHHVAIYVGDGNMIEAAHPGTNVRVSTVSETPSVIRRVLPDSAATSVSASAAAAVTSASSSGGSAAYAPVFAAAEAKYHLPAGLLSAVAKVESGYRPDAVSPAGAEGLMQLMPGTAHGLGVDPLDPAQAIDGAARLLARNLDHFGTLPLALAAYNAGGGAVKRYGGIPPYPETQHYVKAVMAAMGGTS